MAEASPAGYRELARARVLSGHDAWAPMAFADGRLIVRDLTEMVCLDLTGDK
jgi:outer membrane protein assembly factor BamB